MKMQGQKGKCKDDIKSYSLDRFEQVERSKIKYIPRLLRANVRLTIVVVKPAPSQSN